MVSDMPSHTTMLEHDIDVSNTVPIKQHPYRCPPAKKEAVKKELRYLVENGLAKPSCSRRSSSCVLISTSNNDPHVCTDFHKVNADTVMD